ncbi:hypothetical protein [Paracoccus ravus]|uniref:hypothetical protein n=1 Tax=Paracoccus ravus TaxID=2447760 RepID=UPI001FD71221|nr:hypothetical protein [Paracoccus ravus]
MNRILASLALLMSLALMAPPEAHARPSGKPIVIANDKGGNVLQMAQRRQQLERSGRPVEIRGYCRSACTMLITMPNACLGRGATVGFHAPRIPNTQIIPPIVDQLMAHYYRNGILRKWNSEWKHSLKMHKITAKQYVALDPQTKLCAK